MLTLHRSFGGLVLIWFLSLFLSRHTSSKDLSYTSCSVIILTGFVWSEVIAGLWSFLNEKLSFVFGEIRKGLDAFKKSDLAVVKTIKHLEGSGVNICIICVLFLQVPVRRRPSRPARRSAFLNLLRVCSRPRRSTNRAGRPTAGPATSPTATSSLTLLHLRAARTKSRRKRRRWTASMVKTQSQRILDRGLCWWTLRRRERRMKTNTAQIQTMMPAGWRTAQRNLQELKERLLPPGVLLLGWLWSRPQSPLVEWELWSLWMFLGPCPLSEELHLWNLQRSQISSLKRLSRSAMSSRRQTSLTFLPKRRSAGTSRGRAGVAVTSPWAKRRQFLLRASMYLASLPSSQAPPPNLPPPPEVPKTSSGRPSRRRRVLSSRGWSSAAFRSCHPASGRPNRKPRLGAATASGTTAHRREGARLTSRPIARPNESADTRRSAAETRRAATSSSAPLTLRRTSAWI